MIINYPIDLQKSKYSAISDNDLPYLRGVIREYPTTKNKLKRLSDFIRKYSLEDRSGRIMSYGGSVTNDEFISVIHDSYYIVHKEDLVGVTLSHDKVRGLRVVYTNLCSGESITYTDDKQIEKLLRTTFKLKIKRK